MVSTAIRSLLNVIEEVINLRFHTQRNLIPYHALIVAEKNVKNGKNNLNKKNSERMNIINANNKSYSNKQNVKCKVINKVPHLSSRTIIITSIISRTGLLKEGKEIIDGTAVIVVAVQVVVHKTPRPHITKALVKVKHITTSKYLRSKLTCKPKRWQSII